MRSPTVQAWIGLFATVMFAASSAILMLRYDAVTTPGAAMEPTVPAGSTLITTEAEIDDLIHGDLVFVDRSAWEQGAPGTLLLRIAALPGDTVACCDDGAIVVNGARVREDYTVGETGEIPETVVPDGRIYLLGDWRENAIDSRFFADADSGTLPAAEIRSRAQAVVWRPGDFRLVDAGGSPDWPLAGLLAVAMLGAGVVLVIAVRTVIGRIRKFRGKQEPRW